MSKFFIGPLFLLFLFCQSSQAAQYRVQILSGGNATEINALNNKNNAVGQGANNGQVQGVAWFNGQVQFLGVRGCPYLNHTACSSTALDINDKDEIVGWTHSLDNYYKNAYLYTLSGGMSGIVTLGTEWSQGNAINNLSHVVGTARNTYDYNYLTQGYLRIDDNNVIRIGPIDRESFTNDVNESDNAVGCINTAAGRHAYFWSAATSILQDLGTLGGESSCATGINDNNVVVGDADTLNGKNHAFMWSASGGLQDLGSLGDRDKSYARAINNAGLVVGHYEISYRKYWSQNRGFVVENGVMIDLTKALVPGSGAVVIEKANDINDNGVIAASGTVNNSKTMMLLHPMP